MYIIFPKNSIKNEPQSQKFWRQIFAFCTSGSFIALKLFLKSTSISVWSICSVFIILQVWIFYERVRSNLISGLSSYLRSLHYRLRTEGRDVETKLIVKIRNILDSLIFYLDSNSNCQTPLTAPSSPVTWKVRLSVADKKEFSEKANNGLRSCVQGKIFDRNKNPIH